MLFPALPSVDPKRAYGVAFGILALVAAIFYFRTLDGGFVVDDWWWAKKQLGHGWMANDHRPLFYRPIVSVFYWITWSLAGPNPSAFHVLSLVCCVLTAFGVFALTMSLTRGRWVVALLAGLLFVLNPSHPEAVCWGAGMTDTLSSVFAIWGIVATVEFFQTGKKPMFLLGLLLLGLALFSKESVVFAPVIAIGFALTLTEREIRGRRFWAAASLLIALIPIYVIARAGLVTAGVGGYNSIVWRALPGVLVRWGGMVLANDSFLPIYRFIALRSSLDWDFKLHQLGLALLPGILFFGLRKADSLRLWSRSLGTVLVIGMAVYELIVPVWIFVQISASMAPLLRPVLVLAVVTVLVIGVRHGWVQRAREGIRSLYARPVLAFCLLSAYCVHTLWSVLELPVYLSILCVWLIGIGFQWERVPRAASQLCLLGLVTLSSWILAIGPALHLPIGLDGQQSRFAYFGSCFSAMLFAFVLRLIPKIRGEFARLSREIGDRWPQSSSFLAVPGDRTQGGARVFASLIAVAASGIFAWDSIGHWELVGRLSRETVQTMGTMRDADRIVVLGAPSTLDSALLFLGGLEEIPLVMYGSHAKVDVVYRLHFGSSEDRWRIRVFDEADYGVAVWEAPGRRLNRVQLLRWEKPISEEIHPIPFSSLVHLRDMTPKTRVIAIDGGGVRVLR